MLLKSLKLQNVLLNKNVFAKQLVAFNFSQVSQLAKDHQLKYPEFEKLVDQGAIVIDTRPRFEYLKGYIPGSYSVFLSGRFEPWMKKLFSKDDKIVLICKEGEESEVFERLQKIDYLKPIKGYLDTECWQKKFVEKQEKLVSNSVMSEVDFAKFYNENKENFKDSMNVLDVREESEKVEGYLEDSQMISVFQLENKLKEDVNCVDKNKTHFIFCKSGFRATLASSILTKYGITKSVNVGGMDELSKTDISTLKFAEKK